LGGIVPASQVERIFNELLGRSDGKAGQEWTVSYPPVLERRPDEHLEVEEEDGSFTAWEEVDDFADSGPNDRHYTMDNITGTVRFGPTLRDAAGREIQYGATPEVGRQLRFTKYRTGGGTRGNVGSNSITVLKSAIPFVARVSNGGPAVGGEDGESLDQAMIRGPQVLRARSRAVTKDDFEHLAKEAAPEVGRARCVAPTPEALAAGKGAIKLLLVPASNHTDSIIPPAELRLNDRAIADVGHYIEKRRLITSSVALDAPEYRFVSVEVEVKARRRVNKETLQNNILGALYKLINPANGGPDGEGWPWEQDLYESEVTALVQRIDGVEYVDAVRLFVVNPADGARTPVKALVQCPANGLLASFRHLVNVK
jgi:predicted phage baseplate assembly protein